MELYTAEIARLEQRLEEDPDDESVLRRLQKYQGKRQLAIEALKPSAIKVINKHLNESYITYKSSGAKVFVKSYKDKYRIWSHNGTMEFGSIESLAEFLIVSEDLFI